MKRLLSLGLALSILVSLTLLSGCSRSNNEPDSTVSGSSDGSHAVSGTAGTGETGGPTDNDPDSSDAEDPDPTETGENGETGSEASGTQQQPSGSGQTSGSGQQTPNSTTHGQQTPTSGSPTPTSGNQTSKPDDDRPLYTGIVPGSSEAGTSFASLSKAPADKSVTVGSSTKQFGRFLLTTADNAGLPFNVACHLTDSAVTAVLPAGVDLTKIKANFTYYGDKVLYNGKEAKSQSTVFNFSSPVSLTLRAKDGSTKTVTVKIETLATGLPSVSVTTSGYAAINSKTEYISTAFYVGGGNKGVCSYAASSVLRTTGAIKGRGNTSWSFDKKSYTLKLDSQQSMLGLDASKDWALLALHQDKSLLRNYTAAYLSEQIGLEYTMQIRPVDMWLNGSYVGTYALAEKIELEPARVDITKFDSKAAVNKVGYLMEFDRHINEVSSAQKAKWQARGKGFYDPVEDEVFVHLTTIGDCWLVIRSPAAKNLTAAHVNYVYGVVENAMKALKSGDYKTVSAYLDVESFVRWYLLEEYMNNTDAAMRSSVYMYLEVGGKLTLGPVWDFDDSAGNSTATESTSAHPLYNDGNGWFSYLFQMSEPRSLLKANWSRLKTAAGKLDSTINSAASMVRVSAELNFKKWDILGKTVGTNPASVVRANTYDKQVELLKSYLSQRIGALDSFYGSL